MCIRDSYTDPNSVRIGVNWGYTSSQLESQLDPELVIAIAAFLLLVIFTGYLITVSYTHLDHRPVFSVHIALSNLPADADNPSAPGSTAFRPPGTDGYRDVWA